MRHYVVTFVDIVCYKFFICVSTVVCSVYIFLSY